MKRKTHSPSISTILHLLLLARLRGTLSLSQAAKSRRLMTTLDAMGVDHRTLSQDYGQFPDKYNRHSRIVGGLPRSVKTAQNLLAPWWVKQKHSRKARYKDHGEISPFRLPWTQCCSYVYFMHFSVTTLFVPDLRLSQNSPKSPISFLTPTPQYNEKQRQGMSGYKRGGCISLNTCVWQETWRYRENMQTTCTQLNNKL